MAAGEAELQRMIAFCRKLPGLIADAAPVCAQALDAEIRAELSAGRGPDGSPWKPTKQGKRPLPNAAGEATVTKAVGTTLITRAQFPYTFHNAGARGGALPRRPVIPSSVTPQIAKAIKGALTEAWNKRKAAVRG